MSSLLPSHESRNQDSIQFYKHDTANTMIRRTINAPIRKYESGMKRYKLTGENEITDYKRNAKSVKHITAAHLAVTLHKNLKL